MLDRPLTLLVVDHILTPARQQTRKGGSPRTYASSATYCADWSRATRPGSSIVTFDPSLPMIFPDLSRAAENQTLIIHKLTDLENVGDQGSAIRSPANSLLANAETRII